MTSGAAIELVHVWKRYLLGESAGLLGALLHRKRDELWSVKDLSLRLGRGESVGLIGHNGAGKTTSLKLVAGVTRPTRGRVSTHGRVASLINLGAGFHRELTGRENVFLNGVILGLSRREVARRYDEIVEFAELGPYMDTPVKQYSSGMYARLGFSVAAHVDADVLLVDEVLSVGDTAFQDRSIRRMLQFRDEGRSILFVSHNLSAIEMMCDRVIWLDHGAVRQEGSASDVVRAYLDAVDRDLISQSAPDPLEEGELLGPLLVEDVRIQEPSGLARTDFDYGEPFSVRVHCVARGEVVEDVTCTVVVRGDYAQLFSATFAADRWEPGSRELTCTFDSLPVLPGLYRVEVALSHRGAGVAPPPVASAAFRVTTDLTQYGSVSVVGTTKARGGFLAVPYTWRIQAAGGSPTVLPGLKVPPVALGAARATDLSWPGNERTAATAIQDGGARQ